MTPGDQILTDAVRETIAAIRLARRIDRVIPTTLLARSLEYATDEAGDFMVPELLHLGAVWELRWVA